MLRSFEGERFNIFESIGREGGGQVWQITTLPA